MESKAQIQERLRKKLAKKRQQSQSQPQYTKEYVERIHQMFPTIKNINIYS